MGFSQSFSVPLFLSPLLPLSPLHAHTLALSPTTHPPPLWTGVGLGMSALSQPLADAILMLMSACGGLHGGKSVRLGDLHPKMTQASTVSTLSYEQSTAPQKPCRAIHSTHLLQNSTQKKGYAELSLLKETWKEMSGTVDKGNKERRREMVLPQNVKQSNSQKVV